MIKIDRVRNLPFPAIDFKFINRGDASAVLWKIGVEVLEAKLDPTPVLSFSHYIKDNVLHFNAINNGWGPAIETDVTFSQQLLNELFLEDDRRFRGIIDGNNPTNLILLIFSSALPSGVNKLHSLIETRKQFILELCKSMRNEKPEILADNRIKIVLCNHEQWHVQEYFMDLAHGNAPTEPRQKWHIDYIANLNTKFVPINNISVRGYYKDTRDARHLIEDTITFGTDSYDNGRGQLWISTSGFYYETYPPPAFCHLPPSVLIVTMVKIEDAPLECSYPVSLSIPGGEPERFYIVIGSDKSSWVRVRFNFYFDGGNVLHSEPFDLSIWRPLNKQIYIADGTKFTKQGDIWALAD